MAAAFQRRRKALAYHAFLSCAREFAEGAGGTCERLDLARQCLLGRVIQLSVWADGVLWVSVCVRGKGRNGGWSFSDNFTGCALDVGPVTLVGMVESTIPLLWQADPAPDRERLRRVWARVSPDPG